jgi:hypothetical protein
MKKPLFILIAVICFCFLLVSCQREQATEDKQAPNVENQAISTDESEPTTYQKENLPLEPKSFTEQIKDEPAKCQEIWDKKNNGVMTEEESLIMRHECRIPFADKAEDISDILRWWKDEDGYAIFMYDNIQALEQLPKHWTPAVRTSLKNIALNSQFYNLRERAIIALYNMDKKKSIPFIKEVLKWEIEIWGAERTVGLKSVRAAGRILTEAGEYDYAFPYLMKANYFKISVDRNDSQAIPFMRKALKMEDDSIKVKAAWGLSKFNIDREEVFSSLADYIERTNNEEFAESGIRSTAIHTLGEMRDKRAIPILREAYKYEGPYDKQYIDQAIEDMKGTREE